MAARRQVRRAVTVAARPEDVWHALVERDLVARWLGLSRPQPTGRAGEQLHETDGTAWARRVVAATRARRLVFWWWRETGAAPDAGDVSVVEIELDAAGEGTRVTVTETALADHDGVLKDGPEAGAVPVILGGAGPA